MARLQRLNRGKRRQSGPPSGISTAELERFCDVGIAEISHEHLSGWKEGGTYRVYIRMIDNSHRNVVVKDEVYENQRIPALQGLPVRPGPAEALVYRVLDGSALARFLPRLLSLEEFEPGSHYRYVFEDLAPRFHPVRKASSDLMRAVRLLPAMHRALSEAFAFPTPPLNHYDHNYSHALEAYARQALETYYAGRQTTESAALWSRWDEIAELCSFEDLPDEWLRQPIHGDFNRSNIHLSVSADRDARIVDWEWAGFGPAHADLAALLKGAGSELTARALDLFVKERGTSLGIDETWLLQRCRLQRRLLDAAFLARQQAASPRRVPWMEIEVRRAVIDLVEMIE